MRRRAQRQDETRQRIVRAAVDLHTTVGPAHTTDAAIANKAGVTRVTFYRHFPDEPTLFRACQFHGLQRWPPPDPQLWRRLNEPEERLRLGLKELFAYFGVAGPGLTVLMRDAPLMPPELMAFPGRGQVLRTMPIVLAEGWRARGRRRELIVAALKHATAVGTWDSLVRQQGLTDDESIDLLVAMVMAAAEAKTRSARKQASNLDAARRIEPPETAFAQQVGRGPGI